MLFFYNRLSPHAHPHRRKDTFVYECVYESISGVLSTRDHLFFLLLPHVLSSCVQSKRKGKKTLRDYPFFSQPTTREREKKGENDKKKKMVDNILQKWISNWFPPFSLFSYPEETKKKKKKKFKSFRSSSWILCRALEMSPPVRKWSGWITKIKKKKKKKWEKIW